MAAVLPTLSWPEAAGRRLARHGLLGPLASVPAACAAMCGAHAQIASAADLSIGLRVAGITKREIAAALWTERSIVKTIGPRGTWHLVPAADLPTWCAALAAVPTQPGLPPDVRLDSAQTDAVLAAIDAALAEGERTIDELDELVPARCGAWAGEPTMPAFGGFWPRWRQAIAAAGRRGVLCGGPVRGRRVSYAHARRWLPAWVDVDTDAALARVVHDFLHAYGPATSAQFAQWLAAPKPWAAELFARLELDAVELAGERAWVNAGDTAPGGQPSGVRLLPYFDAFVVGSHPRSLLFPGHAAERALAGSQAGNFPVLLVGAEVAGVWHSKRSGNRVAITVEALRRLGGGHLRELDEQVERIAAILRGRADLTLGAVTVGPHA